MSEIPGTLQREAFRKGDIIRHFKRDFLSEEEKKGTMYLYEVIGIAKHTEEPESMLVYKALYPPFSMYCRPVRMAMSYVDTNNYPDAKQEYRLELYNPKED